MGVHRRTVGIDLGSNTLRAVAYDCDTQRYDTPFGAIVRTADGLAQSGRISDAAQQRVIAALGQMRAVIDCDGATVRAVTTEAMRRAENAAEVREHIAAETGIAFAIIDGDEEARCTLHAVRHRLNMLEPTGACDRMVLVDIGGGSTELIFAYEDGTMIARSFPLGIVTLTQSHRDLAAMREALPDAMRPIERFVAEIYFDGGRPDRFVATAGTPTSIAAVEMGMTYATYDPARINGARIDRHTPERVLDRLHAVPFAAREQMVGVGRADLVCAGIVIFERLYHILGMETCTVIDDGLREGVALSLCRGASDSGLG